MSWRRASRLPLAALLAAASACFLAPDGDVLWLDVDVADYDVLPVLRTDAPHPYWDAFVASDEYSYSEMAVDDRIIAAHGTICTAGPCAEDYATYRVRQNAMWMLCPPAGCWLYMARVRDDTLFVAIRDRDWVTLFAPYDSRERAAALIRLRGYHWRADDATTGLIHDRAGGYDFIVLRGNTCGGDVRRYQVTLSTSGVLDTLRSQLYEKGNPNCAS
jgi:hypothetical protein